MIKKIAILLFFISFLAVPWNGIMAQTASEVNIYFFWGEGCPHCFKEKPFLEQLKGKYPEVRIHEYEVWKSAENRQLLMNMGQKLNARITGVPFTVVGEKYFNGWYDEKTTGAAIEEAVQCALRSGCRDIGLEVLAPIARKQESLPSEDKTELLPNQIQAESTSKNPEDSRQTAKPSDGVSRDNSWIEDRGGNPDDLIQVPQKEEDCECEEEKSLVPEKLNVPLLGEISIKNFSLPLLTIVLGALDGFNPCAMWTLLFLISLLLGMKDKKRMWILGSAFIVASAAVYYVFMAAWLNLILFIGLVAWVRVIIGLIAIFGGGYNLKEYFTNKNSQCKVTNTEKRQKVFKKLKNITHQKSFYLALGGIIILAFAVNLVELFCSAGLPAIYTQILAMSNLASWQYYLYILLYIFVFMLDDLIIFFVAMTTLQMAGVAAKYGRWSHLIGGVLMLIIGLLLIFKPEWLMFG